MADEARRPLKVFLCHASGDKPVVRELYKRLIAEGVDAWLDQEKLLPGQDWRVEIPRAVRDADVVVICLSKKSLTKEGYVQREIKFALDSAEEKPEGTIFLIPARLEDCVVPDGLNRWQWVDLFEENGFMRLLRSLKLRADRVGATIEPLGYESEDQEIERRLEQLYTEGLAAFWVEDWDRACQRFQAILRERPSHQNAAEKLAQAERQRNLAKLYAQGAEAYQAENWLNAIKALEGLLEKSADYKDAVQLLKDAKKQRQLRDLYIEAKRLHAAQKWQPIIRIFEQIATIDPAFPDSEGLYPSAQRELTEMKRLDELNDTYRQAVHQMDAGQWHEARALLEKIHKSQIGFLDTERLLRKVENEILRIEELNQRNIHVNTLYEQAHDLIRSKNWRKVVDKIEEIRKLDDQFIDKDGIYEKAKIELEREEQEAQRQRELSALYGEAVSLLHAKKYQEALEKWNELQAIDPNYKDTSRVRKTAKRKLDELTQIEGADQPWRKTISNWFSSEANIPIDLIVLTERLLLVSFVSIALGHIVWSVTANWLHLFDGDIGSGFFIVLLLSFYGIVVAVVYKNAVSSWRLQSSLILIIGWALGSLAAIIVERYITGGFRAVFILFLALSSALAMKWAKVSIRRSGITFIFWALAWWGGQLLGDHLGSVFSTGYTWSVADAFAILLGLLFTFGMQSEGSWEIVKTAFFGALGFAIGNPIVDLMSAAISLPSEVWFAVWGIIGGAVLEAPSRDLRRISVSATVCGIGLLVGSYVAFEVFPAVTNQFAYSAFSDANIMMWRQAFLGIGLGSAIGIFIRRGSATGVLALLGAAMYMLTRALNVDVFNLPPLWESAIRGALIGLVLGFGYGYVRNAEPRESGPSISKTRLRWISMIGLAVVVVIVVLLGRNTYVDAPRASALASSSVDLFSWAPQNAIDGDVGSNWSSNGYDNPVNTEWLAIDMGTPQEVSGIRVVPRDEGYGFPQDFKFQTSNDRTIWTDIPGQSYVGYTNPGSTNQVFTFAPVIARYVRMYATRLGEDDYGNYYFQLEDIYPQRVAR